VGHVIILPVGDEEGSAGPCLEPDHSVRRKGRRLNAPGQSFFRQIGDFKPPGSTVSRRDHGRITSKYNSGLLRSDAGVNEKPADRGTSKGRGHHLREKSVNRIEAT